MSRVSICIQHSLNIDSSIDQTHEFAQMKSSLETRAACVNAVKLQTHMR
jgi:hypothetical protein